MAKKQTNAEWLRKFMESYEPPLTRRTIADALECNVSTVDRWLVPPENKTSHRGMPDMAKRLLQYMEDDGCFLK